MSPYRRRVVLTGMASLVTLSGCSLTNDEQEGSAPPTPDVFPDLTVETDQTWCPSDNHWDPYYHRTPIAPPERPSTITRETAVKYTRSYEAYVLTYLAVAEFGKQTPSSPTPTNRPEVAEFPSTEIRDSSTTVLTTLRDSYVIQLSYIRSIENESRGTYTVNYYVSPEQTIRAETQGDVSPGPNPTKSGTILEC